MRWPGYVNFTKVVLRGCNRPFTDTAATLNKSDSRSIMGFAGAKQILRDRRDAQVFFFSFFISERFVVLFA